MPLYEYRCKNCGHEFEKMVSFSQGSKLPECPACTSQETQKRLSMVASFGAVKAGGAADSCGSTGRFT